MNDWKVGMERGYPGGPGFRRPGVGMRISGPEGRFR